MIKVTIEVHPFGDKSKSRVIEKLYIANMGPALGENAEACSRQICRYNIWRDTDPRIGGKKLRKRDAVTIHSRDEGALMLVAESILDLQGYDYSMTKRRKKKPLNRGKHEEDEKANTRDAT